MAISFANSLENTTSALGSADRKMEVNNTIPISSESSSCCSRAAASSSFAIAKETANERSDPIEERASVAAAPFGIAIPNDTLVSGYKLSKVDVEEASNEGFTVSRNGQLGPLRLRRFLFSTKGSYASPYKRQKDTEGRRHRKRYRPPSDSNSNSCRRQKTSNENRGGRESICFATTFGATLKTVLDFTGISFERKREVASALDDMAAYLSPVSQNVDQVCGSDRDHLINGLATRRVGRRQSKRLAECQFDRRMKRSWLYKTGQSHVTLGATAAILVAHYVLAVTGSQPDEVIENLTRSITVTRNLLDQWNTRAFTIDKMYAEALGAEIRALERARASAAAAQRVAASAGLDRLTALHLQLCYMREAAWPPNAICENGIVHSVNLERLRNGESIESNNGTIPIAPSHGALCLLNKDIGPADEEEDDDLFSDSGRTSSASSFSSYSSSSSFSSGCSSVYSCTSLSTPSSVSWSEDFESEDEDEGYDEKGVCAGRHEEEGREEEERGKREGREGREGKRLCAIREQANEDLSCTLASALSVG